MKKHLCDLATVQLSCGDFYLAPPNCRMKIRHLDLDHSSANLRHDALPLPPVECEVTPAFERPVISLLTVGVLGVLAGLMVHLMHRLIIGEHDQTGIALVKQTLQAPMFWTAVAPCIWEWHLLPGSLACRTCGWETSVRSCF